MAQLPYSYAWANGWNVALASLQNVEDTIYPYTRLRRLTVTSAPLDPFPVETRLMNGRVRGDGQIDHAWSIILPVDAYNAIMVAKFSGGTVKSVQQTVYTRRHELETYTRGNCWLVMPGVASGTLEYLRRGIVRVTFRINDFVAL